MGEWAGESDMRWQYIGMVAHWVSWGQEWTSDQEIINLGCPTAREAGSFQSSASPMRENLLVARNILSEWTSLVNML